VRTSSVHGPGAALVVVGALLSSPGAASADERAKTLFHEGLSLLDAKKHDAACLKFRESLAAEPSVGAMLNVATCSARENRLAQAQAEYRALLVLNEATSDAERRKNVDARAREAIRGLAPRVPTLELSITPAPEALVIELDGKPFERSRLGSAQPVDPGEHVIAVSARGFAPLEKRITLRESERKRHALELSATADPPRRDEGNEMRALLGWITGGIGVAGIASGGALLGVAALRASEIEELCGDGAEPPVCNPAANAARATAISDEGHRLEIGGWLSLGVGGALAVAGGVLLATSLGSGENKISLSPVGPAGPGLALMLAF
jgi:hypothetical protein